MHSSCWWETRQKVSRSILTILLKMPRSYCNFTETSGLMLSAKSVTKLVSQSLSLFWTGTVFELLKNCSRKAHISMKERCTDRICFPLYKWNMNEPTSFLTGQKCKLSSWLVRNCCWFVYVSVKRLSATIFGVHAILQTFCFYDSTPQILTE